MQSRAPPPPLGAKWSDGGVGGQSLLVLAHIVIYGGIVITLSYFIVLVWKNMLNIHNNTGCTLPISAYYKENIFWYLRFFRGGSWRWRFRLERESRSALIAGWGMMA
jgi:hypothetical protein